MNSVSKPLFRGVAFLLLGMATPITAAPLITEFVADNQTGIADEDGAYSDWIEIYNPDATAVDLAGWGLTDNAATPLKWIFPSIDLEPGQFLLIWADGKNRRIPGQPLHANFSLNAGGEYLALVQPDGTVAQDFGIEFPNQDPDRSFGLSFQGTPLVSAGAAAQILVPANASLGNTWTEKTFTPGGWTNGPTGVGFGVLQPGITVRVVKKNTAFGTLGTLALTDALLALPAGSPEIAEEYTQVLPSLNLLGEGGDGHYGGNTAVTLADPNVYAVRGTGYLDIKTAGTYTFGVNSDDGGSIRIDGANVMVDDTNHGPADHFGSVTLSAGLHPFEVVMWEEGGGDEVEFFAAPGTHTVWSTAFQLVGDTGAGGLAALTEPSGAGGGGVGGPVQTDISSTMQGVRSSAYARIPFTSPDVTSFDSITLSMRYADGFVAYLNGTEVARSNAPASVAYNSAATATRTASDALNPVNFNITASKGLIETGSNVLAIHGLNNAVSDGTFLVLPEIIGGGFNAGQAFYFNTATPNGPNATPSSQGKVADTVFSVKRGIYPNATVPTVPFPLSIVSATPGATIRYTTDGTTPTETNGSVYSGPITISGTTVVRAMAYRSNWDSTNVDTQTYLVLDDVLTQSANGTPPSGWPVSPVNGQVLDYGMDPDIVNSANTAIGGAPQVKSALMAVPTLCLTLPPDDLFSAGTGIYTHAGNRGFGWERAASVELLNHPEGEFGERCGVRIRGGFSRSANNPKHSFHLYFRSEWGKGKLGFPLFGDQGAAQHDKIDLRTAQNYSWSYGGDGNNTFLREEFSRATQGDMGQPYSHSFYFHLYLNGQYWGLFNIDERPEASFAAEYLGGSKDDYDVVKSSGSPGGYTTELAQGTFTLWQNLWNQAIAHSTAPAAELNQRYFKMQGLGTDGVTPLDPVADPALLDVDNQIDYLLLVFHMGSSDAPLTGGGDRVNNWFSFRSRAQNSGFVHIVHDMEHSCFNGTDRTGPYSNPAVTDFNYSNPQFIHQHLLSNLEYRTRFGDRVQKHLFNGGALTTEANLARMNDLAATVSSAIIAESARWGDAQVATPRNKLDWESARNFLINNYLPNRNNDVLGQLKGDGLYPATLQGVTFNQFGGYVAHDSPITLTSNGQILYTVDGTDPRLIGGAVNNASARNFIGGTTSTDTLIDWGADAPGATWKYLDPSVDLGSSDVVVGHPSYNASNWKHPSFNDSGAEWKSGDGQLGDGDTQRTVINVGPTGARYQAVYFRKKFTVTDPGKYSSLSLEILRDDGAVIYLNGQEVGRSNAPAGVLGFEYFPNNGVGGTDEETYFTVTDPRLTPAALVAGENTICVEMHQTNASSSDLGFDLRLQGVTSAFPEPIFLDGPGVVTMKARSYDGSNWGSLTETQFLVDAEPPNLNNLVVSEIMYHPSDATLSEVALGYDGSNDFEYIELQNIGSLAIDLFPLRFIAGIQFDFSQSATGRLLLPGQRLLIVGKSEAFAHRYGASAAIAGEFTGTLDNAGETLTLSDIQSGVLRSFTYGTDGEWPIEADGPGYSLVLIQPDSNPDHAVASHWRTSALPYGNPGSADSLNFQDWKISNGVTLDLGDDDHDGLSALEEYGLGTDPNAANSAGTLAIQLIEIAGETYVTLSTTHRIGADDCEIVPEAGSNLGNWQDGFFEIIQRSPNGDGTETITWRTVDSQGQNSPTFARIRFTIQ
jgi:hypothetical protein